MQSTSTLRGRSFTISEKKNIAMLWSQSKLKMEVFCEEQGITISMLKNWRKQFETPAKVPRRKKFIQLTAVKQPLPVADFPFAGKHPVDSIYAVVYFAITFAL